MKHPAGDEMTLAEALEKVELEPGQTYYCSVRGMTVELRVTPEESDRFLPDPMSDDDVVIEPWCELPAPAVKWTVKGKPGAPPLPDALDIPPEGDKPA